MDESRFSIIWIARKRFEKSAAPGKTKPGFTVFFEPSTVCHNDKEGH
jgi:hypothetical protein